MKKSLILIIAAFMISSCTKGLLDSRPASQISDANFWISAADANAGITAIYDALQDNLYLFAYQPFTDGITPIGWIWTNTSNGYANISKGLMTPTMAGVVTEKWKGLYGAIYRANLAIANIPNIHMDETLKERMLAEATFLRALFYYYLADYYGGVPLVTSVLGLNDDSPRRTTREEILQYVISQCHESAMYLPEKYSVDNVGRATKGAALTLKGKAELLIKDFNAASGTFSQVMELGQYSLHNDYEAMFTSVAAENNTEVIFDIQYAGPGLGEGSPMDRDFGPLSSYSRGFNAVFPTQELVDSYEMKNGKLITDPSSEYDQSNPYDNRDPRLSYTIVYPGSSWRGIPYSSIQIQGGKSTYLGYLFKKHILTTDGFAYNESPLNFIVFRYAEVLLSYAEAMNEASGPDASVYSALNEVRARPGVDMPPVGEGKTQAELRQLIRHERKIELAFEGLYYSDIRRWGIAKEIMDNTVIRNIDGQQLDDRKFTDAHYLFPIPQSEIDLNPMLEQNPGY